VLAKCAANVFLVSKLDFVDSIDAVCEEIGADTRGIINEASFTRQPPWT